MSGVVPFREYNGAQVAEQQHHVFKLRLAGRSFHDIAEEMHLGVATVHRREKAAIDSLVTPVLEEARKVELARLDRYLAALDARIDRADDKAIGQAIRISERRARLLGLDAPVQIDATVTETTQADLELAEMVREAKARVAAQELALRNGATA